MSIYGELNAMAENRISNAFDGKREHMVKPTRQYGIPKSIHQH